jgi:nitrile hydratase
MFSWRNGLAMGPAEHKRFANALSSFRAAALPASGLNLLAPCGTDFAILPIVQLQDHHETGAMHDDPSGHDNGDHAHHHTAPVSELEERVRRLESVLVGKGLVDPAAVDRLIDIYEHKIGPRNGAKVVAKAWTDRAFRDWLLADATAAIASLGFTGRQGEHMVAVENTPDKHNLVVCTLCSCYPWPVLGLPPIWYKSPAYRSRAVSEPRAVLAEFGVTLPEKVRIDIWDSTAEVRYLVIPMRPEGTDGWSEDALAALVTRDSMIGAGLAKSPEAA